MTGERIAILGAGSWGTALAQHLSLGGHEAVLWGIEESDLRSIAEKQENPRYFPGDTLSANIFVQADISQAVAGAKLVILATPAAACATVAATIAAILGKETLVLSVAKGLEEGTANTLSEVLFRELGNRERIGVLSGPTFALEVLHALPTAATIAFPGKELAGQVAKLFHHHNFRAYSSTDVRGVELGGVVKNVIAVAAGVVDGIQMGANARAALITRGLAEMQRFIVALGGQPQTVMGLSGLGDLLLTCTEDLSRNRRVGLLLGKEKSLAEALQEVGQTAEGIRTAPILLQLAQEKNISMPIVAEVAALLSGKTKVKDAVNALLSRSQKDEN